MTDDKRRSDRLDLTKLAFAKEGENAQVGLIRDISAAGAYIEFQNPLGAVDHPFTTGDNIDLVLEDETVLVGRVVRAVEDAVAIEFDPANDDQSGFVQALVDAEREMLAS